MEIRTANSIVQKNEIGMGRVRAIPVPVLPRRERLPKCYHEVLSSGRNS